VKPGGSETPPRTTPPKESKVDDSKQSPPADDQSDDSKDSKDSENDDRNLWKDGTKKGF
jgi:hypothetical protein